MGDSVLTLAGLEEIALANNPTILQADARIRAARAKCLQVGLYPNPALIYRGEEMGDAGRAGLQGAFFTQEIVTAGKLRHRQAVVAHEIRQAQHARWAQCGRVLNDLRTAWYDVLVAQRAVELNRQLVYISQQGTKAAEALLAAKEVSRVDLLQARIEQLRAGLQLNDAWHRHLAAWRRMTAVLGIPEMEPTLLSGDPEGELPQLTWQESLEHLLAESPELAQARSGVQRARCAVVREYAQRIPNFALETGVQYKHDTEYTVVGVQLGLPLPIFDRNQGNIFKAQAELTAAENEVRRMELALQDRLATVFQRYASARHQAEKYRSEILPHAKESLDLVGSGYRQGELDYLTLLTAQRTYTQVSLAHLESVREVRAGSVLIEGLLLTGGLLGGNN
jgi:cobalt-zinc-cadmium efflux system outer membrane protein